jgi:4-diphosphocytidyl-2-C-methyl-D-erythritol kinase
LAELGAALGSDVPFFLASAPHSAAAWVSGRGEAVRPLGTLPGLWVVLVNPGFASGTREAFALLDRYREGKALPPARSREELIAGLGRPPGEWEFENDFLPVFMAAGSQKEKLAYGDIIGELQALGAEFAGLSGAVSTS